MPLTIAAMACSRMPKCRLRPPGLPGSKSPAPSNFSVRLGRRCEVGRAAEEPGNVLGEHVQHLARGVAAGDALGIRREARQVAVPVLRAARAAASGRSRWRAPGMLRRVVGEQRLPVAARAAAPRCADARVEMLAHSVGHEELGILRPAIGALGEPDLVVAQRLAVGGGGVDLVRRAVADVAVEDDQRRPALGLAEDRERILDASRDRWHRRRAARSSHRPGSARRHPR